MWNKRPDGELPNAYDPSSASGQDGTTGSAAVGESMPLFAVPTAKAEGELSHKRAVVVGKGVKIVGEIYSSEDLLIEGFVQGAVEAIGQKLTIGHGGTLHASVQVRQLDVQGTIEGDVDACERVDIRKGASLLGNVRAARIVIEDGAYFKGGIDIVKGEAAVKHQAA